MLNISGGTLVMEIHEILTRSPCVKSRNFCYVKFILTQHPASIMAIKKVVNQTANEL